MNSGAKFCYTFMLGLGVLNFFIPSWNMGLSILLPCGFSLIYFIYYIIHKEIYKDIFSNILVALFIMALGVIPILGIIIIATWVIYNISQSIDGIKSLLPELGFSLILYILLGIRYTDHNYSFIFNSLIFLIYSGVTHIYCLRISKMTDDSRDTIFKMSIMWLSFPIIVLLIGSIFASIRSIFQIRLSSFQTTIQTPQQVSGYIRGGTFVEGYTRNITQTVTQTSAQLLPSSGSLTAAMTRSMTETLDSVEDKEKLEKSTAYNNTENATLLLKHDSEDNKFTTNAKLNFYCYGEFDQNKLSNFLDAIKNDNFPSANEKDVLFYFNDTVFGKGDRGAILTKDHLMVKLNYEKPFYVELPSITDIKINGALNRTITIYMNDKTKEMTLTQSNTGANQFFNAIKYVAHLI